MSKTLSDPAQGELAYQRYPNLERLIQLKERVEVIYVVDGYLASVVRVSDYRVLAEAFGTTIDLALVNLDTKLRGLEVEDLRAGKGSLV